MSTRPRRLLAACGVAFVATTALMAPSGTAAAATAPGVQAKYGNTTIDLKQGWSTARSCVVEAVRTTCYASNAEADAALGVTAPAANLALPSCATSYLCLYEHNDGGGRRLMFRDEGWQSLAPYGYANQTSSWRNNQPCNDAAILSDGAGNLLTLGNCAYGASMGSWNDRAVDVGA